MAKRDWQADWELCEAATPGPWEVVHTPGDGTWIANEECGIISPYNNDKGQARLAISKEDLEFTTTARSAFPYWLQRVKELEDILRLAYRALTEGMADVPSGKRYRSCSQLRAEAKQKIREVMGTGETS